jgi:hypothetical protein
VKLRLFTLLLLLLLPASQLPAQTRSNTRKFSPPTRRFRFTYSFTADCA